MIKQTARHAVALGIGVALVCVSAVASAAESVVIVADDVRAPLVQRLVTELANSGYQAELVNAALGGDFATEAKLRHARVVLRPLPLGDSVDIWTADDDSEAVRFRERIASKEGDVSVLALRVREAVHGKLLPTARPPPSRSPSIPPAVVDSPRALPPPLTETPTATPRPREVHFAASAGPAITSLGGGSVAGGVALGVGWLATPRIRVEALGRIPVVASNVDAPEGTAHVSLTLVGVETSWAFASPSAVIRPSIGAGVALAWSHIEGVAASDLAGHTADRLAGVPNVRLSTSLAITDAVGLRADFLAGASLPPTTIRFVGRDVATMGSPVLDASLTFEVRF